MNTFNLDTLKTLKSYNKEDWYIFIDNVFLFKELPNEFSISYEFSNEYFIELNSFVFNSGEIELYNSMHSILISYYFDLNLLQDNFSKIYTLQWVFANIKIRIKSEEFYHQLFKEDLNKSYYNKIHLHSSLLSLISKLPNLKGFDATTYLFSSIDRISDLSFFRVALRYFIEQSSITEYLYYFDKISNKSKSDSFAVVLTESLMDINNYYGSFQQLYDEIIHFWPEYSSNHEHISKLITSNLNEKYLKTGKKWFDNDPYAKMLKIHINSLVIPPPVSLISDILNTSKKGSDSKHSLIVGGLAKIFNVKARWTRKIVIDCDSNNDNWCFISNYPYDIETEAHYRNVYEIEKNKSFVLNADSEFQNFITRNCEDNYKEIEKYDKKMIENV